MQTDSTKVVLASSLILFAITSLDLITNLNAVKISFKQHGSKETFVWYGCLYRLAAWLLPTNETQCGRCVKSGKIVGQNSNKYFMRYINCSSECPHPSVCTEYKFNFNGTWRRECFACHAQTNEEIVYAAIPMSDICEQACRKCALEADLATAIACHGPCRGRPTFCPPKEPLFFGQRICYQSKKLHGCEYEQVEIKALKKKYGKRCVDCATHVSRKDADFCSHYCGSFPTWHFHIHKGVSVEVPADEEDENSTAVVIPEDVIVVMQCKLSELGTLLVYEIPDKMLGFLNSVPQNSLPMFSVHKAAKVEDQEETDEPVTNSTAEIENNGLDGSNAKLSATNGAEQEPQKDEEQQKDEENEEPTHNGIS